jgi:hypothetical protein
MYSNEKILKSISAKIGAALLIFSGTVPCGGNSILFADLILTEGGSYDLTYGGEIFSHTARDDNADDSLYRAFFIYGAMTKNDRHGLRRAPVKWRGSKTENKFAIVRRRDFPCLGRGICKFLIMSLLRDLRYNGRYNRDGREPHNTQIVLMVVSTAIIPAIFEELLYRGWSRQTDTVRQGGRVVFSALMSA